MSGLIGLSFNAAIEALVPLVVAVVLGGLVGWNREVREKSAGLKTHMMVALGAASFAGVALRVNANLSSGVWTGGSDPIRIVQGVATGIGFLGAGAIIRTRGDVQGMTTAAGIWVVGGIGVACGAGLYDFALACTALALVILAVVRRLEHSILRKRQDSTSRPND